jgi:hypothetical protein
MMTPVSLLATGVGSAKSDDVASDGDESKIIGFTAGRLVKESAMERLTRIHTDKSSSSGRIEVVFLLLSPHP